MLNQLFDPILILIVSIQYQYISILNHIGEDEKVTRNAKHINICYHHIQNLIEKKMIEISHISTDEMTVNDLTKTLF